MTQNDPKMTQNRSQNDPFCLMSLLGLGPNMTQNGSILGHFGSFLAIFGDPQISPFWPKPHGSSLLLGLPGQKGSKSGQVLGPGFDPILGHF